MVKIRRIGNTGVISIYGHDLIDKSGQYIKNSLVGLVVLTETVLSLKMQFHWQMQPQPQHMDAVFHPCARCTRVDA